MPHPGPRRLNYTVPVRRLRQILVLVVTLAFMLPVVAVFASWLPWGDSGAAAQILREMSATVLPDYVGTTVLLCLMVAAGVMGVVVPAVGS